MGIAPEWLAHFIYTFCADSIAPHSSVVLDIDSLFFFNLLKCLRRLMICVCNCVCVCVYTHACTCWVLVGAYRIFSCGMQDFFFFLTYSLWELLLAPFGIFSCGLQTLSCSMWGLAPWPRIIPGPPAFGAQNPSHWTGHQGGCLSVFKCSVWACMASHCGFILFCKIND